MKIKKKASIALQIALPIALACALAILAGCSDSDSGISSKDDLTEEDVKSSSSEVAESSSSVSDSEKSSSSSKKENSNNDKKDEENSEGIIKDDPTLPNVSVKGCKDVSNATLLAKLEQAKKGMTDFYQALFEGDISKAQVIGLGTKNLYATVLNSEPGSCEAQVGYALSVVSDILNKEETNQIVDTLKSYFGSYYGKTDYSNTVVVGETAPYVMKLATSAKAGKLLSEQIQSVAAGSLAEIDSAVIYMKNVINAEDFTIIYTNEGQQYELDNGEFGPMLGALYALKAAFTVVASLDIDASIDGSYEWLVQASEYDFMDAYANPKYVKHVESLLSLNSPFSKVKADWKSKFAAVPEMLENSLSAVQLGLQYGIKEAETGLLTQLYDPYVVGDDYEADVSVADFQALIDNLTTAKKALRGDVTIQLQDDFSVKVNLAKFFAITDGYQKYLPYYELVDSEHWFDPDEDDEWENELDEDSYAMLQIREELNKFFDSKFNEHIEDLYISNSHWDSENDGYVDMNAVRFYLGNRSTTAEISGYVEYSFDGCDYELKLDKVYSHDHDKYGDCIENYIEVDYSKTGTIDSRFCKVSGGEPMFVTAYHSVVPNIFYFTDANKKKTFSFRQWRNGYKETYSWGDYTYTDWEHYSFREVFSKVHFPDVTFGGVFPDMTKDKLGDMLRILSEM